MNDIIHVDNMDKYENVKKLIVEFRQGNDLSVPVDNIKFVKIDGESDAVAPTPTPTPDPEPSGSSWVENFQPTGAVMPIGLAAISMKDGTGTVAQVYLPLTIHRINIIKKGMEFYYQVDFDSITPLSDTNNFSNYPVSNTFNMTTGALQRLA